MKTVRTSLLLNHLLLVVGGVSSCHSPNPLDYTSVTLTPEEFERLFPGQHSPGTIPIVTLAKEAVPQRAGMLSAPISSIPASAAYAWTLVPSSPIDALIGSRAFIEGFHEACVVRSVIVTWSDYAIEWSADGDDEPMEIILGYTREDTNGTVAYVSDRIWEDIAPDKNAWHPTGLGPVSRGAPDQSIQLKLRIYDDDGESTRTQSLRLIDEFAAEARTGLALEMPSERLKSIQSIVPAYIPLVQWGYDFALFTWGAFTKTDPIVEDLTLTLEANRNFLPSGEEGGHIATPTVLDTAGNAIDVSGVQSAADLLAKVALGTSLKYWVICERPGICRAKFSVIINYDNTP